MTPARGRRLALAAAALAAALGSGAPPAHPAPAETGRDAPAAPRAPLERVTTELVLIETYVTDLKGRPISGLVPDDFVLIVDGGEKPIASLEYREPPPAPDTGAAAGSAAALSASRTPASRFPRRIVLFFEDSTSFPRGLAAARQAADRFLAGGLAPSDQVALAAYDRRLRILHDFTTDRESLRQAIARSLADPVRLSDFAEEQRSRDEELRRLLSVPGRHTPGSRAGGGGQPATRFEAESARMLESQLRQASILATNYASEEGPRLARALGAVRTLIDSLAAWPGYKALVFMGDGIPENPAQPYLDRILALGQNPEVAALAVRHSLTPEIEAVSRAAAAAGVTIHTIQTLGLGGISAADLTAARRRSNSLTAVALNTGGVASTSNDLLRALQEADAATRAYYVLGYVPEGPPDGRYHWVQIRLRDKGRAARLRFRRGFTRLTPSEARSRTLLAAHLLPELYTDIPFDLTTVPGPAGGSGRVVDLVLHLPSDRLLFLPEAGGPTARAEVGFVSLDDSGRETFRAAGGVRLTLGPEAAGIRHPGVNLFCRALLPEAAQGVTAVVLDAAAGVVGSARLRLPAASPGDRPIAGLSLYSLSDRSVWVEIPAAVAAGEPPADYTVGPALKTRFTSGEPIACGFRTAGQGGGPFRLLVRGGTRTFLDLEVPADGPGAEGTRSLPLPLERLEPGDYVLVVEEAGPLGPAERGRLTFQITPGIR